MLAERSAMALGKKVLVPGVVTGAAVVALQTGDLRGTALIPKVKIHI